MSSCFKLRISEIFAPEAILIFGKLCQQSWLNIQTVKVLTVDSVIILKNNYFYKYSQTIIPPVLTKFRLIHPGSLEGGNRALDLKSQPSSKVSTNSYTNRSNYYYSSDPNKHKIFHPFYWRAGAQDSVISGEWGGGYGRCLRGFGWRILVLVKIYKKRFFQ